MKHYLPLISATAFALTITGPNLFAAELTVEVTNIQPIQSTLYISLYKDAQGFNANNNFVRREKINVDKNTTQLILNDLPAGDYALKAFQDVNNNGKMDFDGIRPAEPYGSSSNSTEFAPPNFLDARFTLDKDQKVKVQLQK